MTAQKPQREVHEHEVRRQGDRTIVGKLVVPGPDPARSPDKATKPAMGFGR